MWRLCHRQEALRSAASLDRQWREAPTAPAESRRWGHCRSRRRDAAAIAAAASAIAVPAALCAQDIANALRWFVPLCGDMLVARVELQTESTQFTCPSLRNWISFLHKRIIFWIYEANVLSWRACERGVTQLQAMHQDRLGTNAQKAISQRLETVGTKWIAGVRTNFSLMMLEGPYPATSLTSRRSFGRRLAELFKGEDKQLAWSGVEGGGSKRIK